MGKDFDNISAVLFDVDGTLYDQAMLRRIMAMKIAKCFLTGKISPRQLKVISCYRKQLETLRVDLPPDCKDLRSMHLQTVADRTGMSVDYVDAAVTEWMLEASLPYLNRCLRKGVAETLTRLKQADYKLGVLSDYPAKEKLEAMGLAGFFDEVISCQAADISAYKPDTDGFARLARSLDVAERSCVYVGDRFEIDIIGASNAGMNAVWLTSRTKTRVLPANCRQITEFSDLERLLL
jgi:HAD superfamily hydrolase (TIGR01549 family)